MRQLLCATRVAPQLTWISLLEVATNDWFHTRDTALKCFHYVRRFEKFIPVPRFFIQGIDCWRDLQLDQRFASSFREEMPFFVLLFWPMEKSLCVSFQTQYKLFSLLLKNEIKSLALYMWARHVVKTLAIQMLPFRKQCERGLIRISFECDFTWEA